MKSKDHEHGCDASSFPHVSASPRLRVPASFYQCMNVSVAGDGHPPGTGVLELQIVN
jgi:hypothetical protein